VGVLAFAAAASALTVLLAAQQLGLGFDGQVQASPVPPLQAGAEGELSVTLLETPSDVSPLSVRLSSAVVRLPDDRLGERDVVDPQASQPRVRARFFAPDTPGRYEVQGLVEYVTCDAERCRPRRRRVVWSIEVSPAPGAAAPAEPSSKS